MTTPMYNSDHVYHAFGKDYSPHCSFRIASLRDTTLIPSAAIPIHALDAFLEFV